MSNDMDEKAIEAKKELDDMLDKKGKDASADDIFNWYLRNFQGVWHKRLGRTIYDVATKRLGG